MRYIFPLSVLCAAFLATGCGSEESSDKSYRPVQNYQPTTTAPANNGSPMMNNTTTAVPPTGNATQNIQVTPAAQQPVTALPAAGLNPEHGQPGHRCDIAVGAPLNSKPAAPTAQVTPPTTTNTQPIVINTNSPAKPAAKGMNPEHGQPGHRCDIAVGAPLDSKSAAPAATTTQPATNIAPMQVTPVQPVQKPAAPAAYQPVIGATGGVVGNGVNPEHGKPGHRCDIAVGAPLNSAPAQKQ